ncbi:MAG: 50S ribosomal protein L23 [Patescibacteria group bacterium]|jgi:large subunit ribosomal protein L23
MGLLDRFKKQGEENKPEKKLEKKPETKGKVANVKNKKPETRSFDPSLVPSVGKESEQKKETSAKEKEAVKGTPKKLKSNDTKDAYRVLVRPIITEKANSLGVLGQYVFEVYPSANKVEIRKAIKALYGVNAINVRIINIRGRQVQYGRHSGTTKYWKKAVVSLKAGEKIEIFEGV